MTGILDWLAALPAPLLFGAMVVAAFAENVFPPLPADTVVALGAFVAARGGGSALGAWAATMVGNLSGAMLMFGLGRRFGMARLAARLPALGAPGAAERLAERYRAQGAVALVVSRFLPAVRALVPPLAGALGIAPLRAFVAMGVASAAWYGLVCWLAFGAGANADALLATIARRQREAGIVAAVLAGVAAASWALRARRRRSRDGRAP
jgi:membrane protein DedA with SNARE-associated domain